uniref:Uncharacterized protein n=1 Tax=Anguilla anguilla TaxID=7936 RepID=A0A0E9QFF8_ANGAN
MEIPYVVMLQSFSIKLTSSQYL